MSRLPTAEELFDTYFRPWYPDQGNDRSLYGLLPDLEEIELPKGTSISVLQPLHNRNDRRAVLAHLDRMTDAAQQDFPTLFGVTAPPSPDWIAAFEAQVDEAKIRSWIEQSPPGDLQNNLLVLTCETAVILAQQLISRRPGLQWLPDVPYWESALFDLNTRVRVPVFHWVIKRLGADFGNEPLQPKIDATIAFIEDTP